MKHLLLSLLCFIGLFTSCTKNTVTKETELFFGLIRQGDVENLALYYPSFDSKYLSLGSDAISIHEVTKLGEDEYEVQLINNYSFDNNVRNVQSTPITLYFTKNEGGQPEYIITNSRGLIDVNDVPYYTYDTGCLDPNRKYDDNEIIRRVEISKSIVKKKVSKICKDINKHITITSLNYNSQVRWHWTTGDKIVFRITNRSSYKLNGFYVHFELADFIFGSKYKQKETGHWDDPGSLLLPGKSKTYTLDIKGSQALEMLKSGYNSIIAVADMELPEHSLAKYNKIKFKGTEYKEYLKDQSN